MSSSAGAVCTFPTFCQLVVLDFDGALLDGKNENYLFNTNDTDLLKKIIHVRVDGNIAWTYPDCISEDLETMYQRNIRKEHLGKKLGSVHLSDATAQVLKNLGKRGDTTLLCLSDANEVSIEIILEKAKLNQDFKRIITNPAGWQRNRLPKVSRRVGLNKIQHSCVYGIGSVLCDGHELEGYIHYASGTVGVTYTHAVYVGDSVTHFCPVVRHRNVRFPPLSDPQVTPKVPAEVLPATFVCIIASVSSVMRSAVIESNIGKNTEGLKYISQGQETVFRKAFGTREP